MHISSTGMKMVMDWRKEPGSTIQALFSSNDHEEAYKPSLILAPSFQQGSAQVSNSILKNPFTEFPNGHKTNLQSYKEPSTT
jgi:hypothetical protein